jgi:hypothetical protein
LGGTDGTVDIGELLTSIIGKPTGTSKVVVERAPVTFFADAVLERSDVYRSPTAAREAGLAGIPAPPTYGIALETWGKYPELQPTDGPTGAPLMDVLGPLMAKGGLILHGEQEFIYHRPITVGDVLVGEGHVADAYQKESKGRTMTFVVTETNWSDDKTGEPVVTTRFNVIHRA